ncbi:hypothetical protein MHZ95_02930 [Sporosarcina sp. ACRSM]|uniref:hypothetical protein n=1 Tax=Sporosarcina sp. ACRSM TaxID=2918216 RepID=UPI001EF5C8B1|nr:hypothetical protein [Sporosarcina sp. ACRSM]MCG7334231.1 hypothetical protein [Sporosarcina sp. ACRSM]
MWKKIAVFAVLLIITLPFLPAGAASAAPALEVDVNAGLDGKAKYGKGAPVSITIENTGSAFSGDLVIDLPFSYSMGTGKAIPLDLGAGETKTVSIVVQNMVDTRGVYGTSNPKTIFLYEGGWRNGKELDHTGDQQLTTNLYSEDTKIIALLTDNIDRLRAMNNVKFPSAPNTQLIDAAKVSTNLLPAEAEGWGAANYIIADEYPVADLSGNQQEALLDWVRSGGVIIFGGSDNSSAEAGIFRDYLPLQLKGKTSIDGQVLSEWTGMEGFDGAYPAYLTELQAGSTPLFKEDQNVLAAYRQFGQGAIMQTSFSVGDEPLAKTEGMTAIWQKLFEAGESIIPSKQPFQSDPLEAMTYTIGRANELFPSFKVSAPVIFGIIILYIIIIIPVLYMILKRKDKREYAWWLIPVIAVVTSIAIFAYGAKDRIGRSQIQHSAVLTVEQDGRLSGHFAESVLTNQSGDYTFSAPLGTTLAASMPGSLFNSSSAPSHKQTIVEQDASGVKLHLRKIGYWDVATVYGKARVEKTGQLDQSLRIEDQQLAGTITNVFPFALTDIAIWSGGTLIPIGDLGPGETIDVHETLKSSTLLPSTTLPNQFGTPFPSGTDDLVQMRKNELLTFAGEQLSQTTETFLIGFTDTQVIPVELEKGKPSISSMTLLVQPVEADVLFNKTVTVEPDMMTMSLLSENGRFEASPSGSTNQYFFSEAAYIQTWQLPKEFLNEQLDWTSIEVREIQQQLYEASLLNVRTGKFERSESENWTIEENVKDYISPEGKIVIRMVMHDAKNGNEGHAPELKLNGEVVK